MKLNKIIIFSTVVCTLFMGGIMTKAADRVDNESIMCVSKDLKTQEIEVYSLPIDVSKSMTLFAPGSDEQNVATNIENDFGIDLLGIIGDDNRKIVSDPTATPYSHICYAPFTYGNGSAVSATAWLAGPSVAVTSAHCVYDAGKGGWIKSMRLYPGYTSGKSAPFGSANVVKMHVYQSWIDEGGAKNDFAILELDRPIGNNAGYFGFAYGTSLVNQKVRITGYPGNRQGIMKKSVNIVYKETEKMLYHYVDTTGDRVDHHFIVAELFTVFNHVEIRNIT